MDFDSKEIGLNIKCTRKKQGITRCKLAESMYISEDTIKKWEQGKRTPRLPDLLSLASVLKTNV